MKVYIGPYPNELKCCVFDNYMSDKYGLTWEYKHTEKLTLFEKSVKLFNFVVQFFVYDSLNFLYFRRIKEQRKYIKIDYWDVWSMDQTLALIILPMLKELREVGGGAPVLTGEDVPEELRPTDEEVLKFSEGKVDDKNVDRWNYILDEMIWTFDFIVNDDEYSYTGNEFTEKRNRVKNGLRLFGKYYQSLWN